jgi:hypothetical protein
MEWINEDILKLIVIGVAFAYFRLKVNIASSNRGLISIGLILLFSAAVLDFADGIKALENTPILSRADPWHDILEDQVFDTLGLVLLLFGSFREMNAKGRITD